MVISRDAPAFESDTPDGRFLFFYLSRDSLLFIEEIYYTFLFFFLFFYSEVVSIPRLVFPLAIHLLLNDATLAVFFYTVRFKCQLRHQSEFIFTVPISR